MQSPLLAIQLSQRFFNWWNSFCNELSVTVRNSLTAFSCISSMVWKRRLFKMVLSLENSKKSAGAKSGEKGGWGTTDVWLLPDNCCWGATREPAHCHGATSKCGFPTVQTSSYAKHPSNELKLSGTTVCLASEHVVCDLEMLMWRHVPSCTCCFKRKQ